MAEVWLLIGAHSYSSSAFGRTVTKKVPFMKCKKCEDKKVPERLCKYVPREVCKEVQVEIPKQVRRKVC